MTRSIWRLLFLSAAAASVVAVDLAPAQTDRALADAPVESPRPEASEAEPPAPTVPRDVRKMVVEKPLKSVVASTRVEPTAAETTPAAASAQPAEPPRNAPGQRSDASTPPRAEVATSLPADDSEPGVRVRVRRDMGKSVIETPLKSVVASTRDALTAIESGAAPAEPAVQPIPSNAAETVERANSGTADNPLVTPGDVRWHDDFDEARAAARNSGRPVLLFQLMGRLDQRFT